MSTTGTELIGKKIESEIFRIFKGWRLDQSSGFFGPGQRFLIRYHKKDKTTLRPLRSQSMSFTYSRQFQELEIPFYFNPKTQVLSINRKPVSNTTFLEELNSIISVFQWEVSCDDDFNLTLTDNSEEYLPYNVEILERLNIKSTGESTSGYSGNWTVYKNSKSEDFKIHYHYNHTFEKVEVILKNGDSKFVYTFNELVLYLISNKIPINY